jgi:hypothetical protein
MNKEEYFSIWAPDESPWSRWAKPVLFAHLDVSAASVAFTETAMDASWAPVPNEKVALVLDLPGAEGVLAGIALAARGYRPVPLYNAIPMPAVTFLAAMDPVASMRFAAVNVAPILNALKYGAGQLAEMRLPNDAPPAFLLDANRAGDGRRMSEGEFDNRSISFTTDFPSANYFAAHGIERVMLVQKDRADLRPDLAHSLRRWQEAGFVLERKRLDTPGSPERFEIPRPSWYGTMFQRVIASLGLRRSSSGGFGAWIASSSAGG